MAENRYKVGDNAEPLKWRGQMSAADEARLQQIRGRAGTEEEADLLRLLDAELHRVKCLQSDLAGMDVMYKNLSVIHDAYSKRVGASMGRLRYVQSLLSREMKFERNPDSRIGRAYTTVTELLGV